MDDPDSAVSRAYYAMFDAARAVLMASNIKVKQGSHGSHVAVITAFEQDIVGRGAVTEAVGNALNRARMSRMIADYQGGSVVASDAEAIVQQAEEFLTVVVKLCSVTK
jgi:uncharacterized protein (UPF0332 family)